MGVTTASDGIKDVTTPLSDEDVAIGKGYRGDAVKQALREHKALYLGAIGGAGAVLSRFVKKVDIGLMEGVREVSARSSARRASKA